MNRLDQDLEILDRRFGQNAVTEVEDVARLSAGAAQHFTRAFADQVRWAEQHRWVEVALNPAREADSAPSVVQSYAPVQGHYVRTGFRDWLGEARGVGPEVNPRHVERLERLEDCASVAHDARFVVLARQPSFDQVAGKREWCAREADHRYPRLPHHAPHRGDDRGRGLLPVRHSQPLDI